MRALMKVRHKATYLKVSVYIIYSFDLRFEFRRGLRHSSDAVLE